jgi:hypothetical protein
MAGRFRLGAVVLVLALLAQPASVMAACPASPAKGCPLPEEQNMQDMHCPPASQLQAQDRSACCDLRSAPAAPPKTSDFAVELTAAVVPVKTSDLTAAPIRSLHPWTYHDPPQLLDTSQAQALLCVFLI